MNSPKGIRAFLALSLPPAIQEDLHGIGDLLRSEGVDAAWEPVEKLHVTIRFLGEMDQSRLDALGSTMQTICDRIPPFDLVFTHVGAFPDPDRPRVVWVGAHKSARLLSLMSTIEHGCREAGLEPETRPPHPHVTLARVKRWHSTTNLTALLKSVTFDPILTRSPELTLMRSVLHRRGSTYSTLTSFPFNRTWSSHG